MMGVSNSKDGLISFVIFFYTTKISGPNRLILRSLKSDGGKEGETSR